MLLFFPLWFSKKWLALCTEINPILSCLVKENYWSTGLICFGLWWCDLWTCCSFKSQASGLWKPLVYLETDMTFIIVSFMRSLVGLFLNRGEKTYTRITLLRAFKILNHLLEWFYGFFIILVFLFWKSLKFVLNLVNYLFFFDASNCL